MPKQTKVRMPAPEQTRFKIEVTERDIERAHRSDSYKCVVAQAVARTIPDAVRVEVDLQTIRFTRVTTGERLLYLTPNIAAGYVVAFDAGDEIHPFEFRIGKPVKTVRRVKTEAGKQKEREATRKARARKAAGESVPAVAMTPGADPALIAAAVKEEYEAAQHTITVKGGEVPPKPRTYKTGKRTYGGRILRVNKYLREQAEQV